MVFRLELPPTWKIHDVFHTSLLTPYQETTAYGVNYPEPPPELVEGEEEYIVDRILNSRRHGRNKQLQFLIHWEGYSTAHDSWEPAKEVHTPAKIEEYYQRKKGAIRAISIKGHQEKDKPYQTTPLVLPLLTCSRIQLMDNGTTQQSKQPTATIPQQGEQDGGHDQHIRIARWYHNDAWYYAQSVPAADAPHTLADDNWQRLYRALLNLDSPRSNAPGFDNTPRLVEDTRAQLNVLTPPLTEDFCLTTDFQNSTTSFSTNSWDHLDPAFSLIPINSTVASPWDEDQLSPTMALESLQPRCDVYHSTVTPGSDADRQQRLHAELRDSLRACPVDPQDGEWYYPSSPRLSAGVKRPSLDKVAMRTTPRKKA